MSWRRLLLGASVIFLVGLAVWRATLGLSFFDDGHYAAIPYYFAQGGVPLASDMTIQSLGFLASAPIAFLWSAIFGTTGLVLALRIFYIALAVAGGVVIFRALRPSVGDVPALVAAVAPLLAPPYNIIGVSYNTVGVLAYAVALALAHSALRDRDGRAAVWSGAALALGAVSYPPLAVGGLLFVACFAILAHNRRLSLSLLGGGAAVVAIFGAWVVLVPGLAAARRALDYSSSMWGQMAAPLTRLESYLRRLRSAFTLRSLAPMWLLAVTAALPRIPPRVRAAALALVPLAAAAPGLRALYLGNDQNFFGSRGSALLILVTAALAVPVVAWALRAKHRPLLQLLALSASMSVANYLIVATSTNSGFEWGIAFTGLAPLAATLLCGWALAARDMRAPWATRAAAMALVGVLIVMLFARTFKDANPLDLHERIRHGAAAGVVTTEARARAIAADEAIGSRWVAEDDGVLVIASPLSYLLVGGRARTNAIWLNIGPSDQAAVDYFERTGKRPDVIFVALSVVEAEGGLEARAPEDPLFRWLLEHYRLAETGEHLVAYVPR